MASGIKCSTPLDKFIFIPSFVCSRPISKWVAGCEYPLEPQFRLSLSCFTPHVLQFCWFELHIYFGGKNTSMWADESELGGKWDFKGWARIIEPTMHELRANNLVVNSNSVFARLGTKLLLASHDCENFYVLKFTWKCIWMDTRNYASPIWNCVFEKEKKSRILFALFYLPICKLLHLQCDSLVFRFFSRLHRLR